MLVKTNLPVASRAGSTERGALPETDNAAEEQFAWGHESGCLGSAGQPTRSSPNAGVAARLLVSKRSERSTDDRESAALREKQTRVPRCATASSQQRAPTGRGHPEPLLHDPCVAPRDESGPRYVPRSDA